jgi:hypothetical protein
MRWRINDRSNSANAPVTWKTSLPMGAVVVDRLLIEVKIDAAGLQMLDGAQEVNQGSS